MRDLASILKANGVEPKKPEVKLGPEDNDFFVIIDKTAEALYNAGLSVDAEVFKERAVDAKSYGDLLFIAHDFVEIETDGNDEQAN